VTNAVKHGFRDCEAETVALSMRQTDGNSVTLSVTDDGVPLPINSKSNSVEIGLTLISRLADQLGGALTVTATPKRFAVVFSALAAEQR
jgi:two-component sensor histidine kinase